MTETIVTPEMIEAGQKAHWGTEPDGELQDYLAEIYLAMRAHDPSHAELQFKANVAASMRDAWRTEYYRDLQAMPNMLCEALRTTRNELHGTLNFANGPNRKRIRTTIKMADQVLAKNVTERDDSDKPVYI